MENQTGKKIKVKVLRSNNGGEYTSHAFNELCREESIRRSLIVSYTPQHNGVAERKNRSIVGATRAMLHDQSLHFFLSAEACSTIVYVLNKSLHHALGCKTLEEMFTGKVPEIGHFWIFGALHTHMYFLRRGQSWRL